MTKKQINTINKLFANHPNKDLVNTIMSFWKTEAYGRDYLVLDQMGEDIARKLHCRSMSNYPCILLFDFLEKPGKLMLHLIPFNRRQDADAATTDFNCAHRHAEGDQSWVEVFFLADPEDLFRDFQKRWMRCHYHIGLLGNQLAVSTTSIEELYGLCEDH